MIGSTIPYSIVMMYSAWGHCPIHVGILCFDMGFQITVDLPFSHSVPAAASASLPIITDRLERAYSVDQPKREAWFPLSAS